MPAIREQLEERWETAEGQRIAREVRRLLATGMPGATGPREVTAAELQQLVVSLPFNEEIAPRLDLRGLHLDQESIDLYQASDLSGAHLEYAYEIGAIMATRMVGTVFDACRSTNAIFSADFTSASFVAASLQGVRFWDSILVEADFRQAKLALAEFRDRDCRRASFVEADLRFADLVQADLRGSDFSGANLTEANLSGVKFDEQTRLQGANLRGATLDEQFRAFAQQAGAVLSPETPDPSFYERELAELAAVIRLLREDNEHGHLDVAIVCLTEQLQRFAHDPTYPWSQEMHKALSPDMEQKVLEYYGEVGRALAYYL
jgi:uncharacterized protein YjbI with pentapeptide repeats